MIKIIESQIELDKKVNQFKYDNLVNFAGKIEEKVHAIYRHFTQNNIERVVLGVSGGIDSAVVLGLLVEVQKQFNINGRSFTIYAYNIDFDIYNKVYESKYYNSLVNTYKDNVTFSHLNLNKTLDAFFNDMQMLRFEDTMAQVSYAMRYLGFFAAAQYSSAVTIGTTNKDEFQYAGWFGKNSDMVVDFQIITDWYKFQVIEAAILLGIPEDIIERIPVGDLIDNSTDEENFGCSYDELSFFGTFCNQLITSDFLTKKFKKLIKLHEKNLHKYQGQTFNPIFIS